MELDRKVLSSTTVVLFLIKINMCMKFWISIIDSFTSVANKWTMSIKEEFSHMLHDIPKCIYRNIDNLILIFIKFSKQMTLMHKLFDFNGF